MAAEKTSQEIDGIVHSLYWQETNLVHLECSYCHLNRIRDKVRSDSPLLLS